MSIGGLRFVLTVEIVRTDFRLGLTIVNLNVNLRPKKQFKNCFFVDKSKMSIKMSIFRRGKKIKKRP